MGMYGFKAQFVPLVESGAKTHTIRADRKYPDKPGSVAHCYYAPRTKQCRHLGSWSVTLLQPIVIANSGRKFKGWDAVVDGMHQFGPYPQIEIAGDKLADDEMETLARRDGFPSLFEMSRFWDLTQPFHGSIIHWNYAARVK